MFARMRKVLVGIGVVALLVTAGSGAVAGEKPLPPGVTRLAGENRFDTSAAVAAQAFTAPVEAVFVATGADFPDALAAGPAAAHFGGPVLLVQSNRIPASVRAQLSRLKPETIYVLGGRGVVSGGVAEELGNYAPSVKRLSGQNRYATAVEVSRRGWDSSSTVFLASGAGFADALSGGAAAATRESPLLLTPRNTLAGVTRDELVRLKPTRVFVLGGKAAVDNGVVASVQKALPSARVTRIAGENRYATAAKVARTIWPDGTRGAFFATGDTFADALSGTPAAAANNAPLLLSKRECLPRDVYAVRADFKVTTTGILGGSQALLEAGATQECGTNRYSGSGDDVLKITKPGGATAPALVTLTHSGSRNFIVWGLNKDLENTDLLANEIGDYKGRVLLDAAEFDTPQTSTHLDITADGAWTVTVQPIGAARSMSSNKTTGAGDDVLRWTGKAAPARFTHDGDRNFIVWAREADGDLIDLLINTIGDYNGRVNVPSGTRLVTVEADGRWSITMD